MFSYFCVKSCEIVKSPCCVFLPVNSYGEDEELTTSSDSDDEVIKQFAISVSRSQSFRSGVSEKATQAGSERKPKFNRLLSSHEEYSTEASECEGIVCLKWVLKHLLWIHSHLTWRESFYFGEGAALVLIAQAKIHLEFIPKVLT